MNVPVLRLREVSKGYDTPDGRIPVLDGVDLELLPGQKVSLVGPSGSGKSTLLALIAGLLNPDAGSIEVAGKALGDLDDDSRAALRAQSVGIVLQSNNLIPFLSASENVSLALRFGGRPSDRAAAVALLERFGVGHRARHLPRRLSGGEAQRVALAVALANEPDLLLADEFVSQLDGDTASAVLKEVLGRKGAILFVTHDPDLALRADLRLRLSEGKVVVA